MRINIMLAGVKVLYSGCVGYYKWHYWFLPSFMSAHIDLVQIYRSDQKYSAIEMLPIGRLLKYWHQSPLKSVGRTIERWHEYWVIKVPIFTNVGSFLKIFGTKIVNFSFV